MDDRLSQIRDLAEAGIKSPHPQFAKGQLNKILAVTSQPDPTPPPPPPPPVSEPVEADE